MSMKKVFEFMLIVVVSSAIGFAGMILLATHCNAEVLFQETLVNGPFDAPQFHYYENGWNSFPNYDITAMYFTMDYKYFHVGYMEETPDTPIGFLMLGEFHHIEGDPYDGSYFGFGLNPNSLETDVVRFDTLDYYTEYFFTQPGIWYANIYYVPLIEDYYYFEAEKNPGFDRLTLTFTIEGTLVTSNEDMSWGAVKALF